MPPKRTAVDKLLSYSWVRDAVVAENEDRLLRKLTLSLTKAAIEASAALPLPFIHAITVYADAPRGFAILKAMRLAPLCDTYWENPNYRDTYGNSVLANLCSRAYYSLPDNPVRQLVDELGGRPTPANPCKGVVINYLK